MKYVQIKSGKQAYLKGQTDSLSNTLISDKWCADGE